MDPDPNSMYFDPQHRFAGIFSVLQSVLYNWLDNHKIVLRRQIRLFLALSGEKLIKFVKIVFN